MTAGLNLHVPDEPTVRAHEWVTAVNDGNDVRAVLSADDGFVDWLWARWSTLGGHGMTSAQFAEVVLGNQREIWLWLAGERTWNQACSGLLGRVHRRMTQVDAPTG